MGDLLDHMTSIATDLAALPARIGHVYGRVLDVDPGPPPTVQVLLDDGDVIACRHTTDVTAEPDDKVVCSPSATDDLVVVGVLAVDGTRSGHTVGDLKMSAAGPLDPWLTCDGQTVSLDLYPALAALTGIWGSAPAGQVRLPDLRGRVLVGAGPGYTLGAVGGQATVTLTTAQLPQHAHGAGTLATNSAGAHGHGLDVVAGPSTAAHVLSSWSVAGPPATPSGTGSVTVTGVGGHVHPLIGSTGNQGSGVAHENRPPFAVISALIWPL